MENYIEKLNQLNQVIKVEVENVIKQKTLLEDVKDKMKLKEAEFIRDINNEVDGKGKALFSNEAVRQAELTIRMSMNMECRDLKKEMKDKFLEIQVSEELIKTNMREFSIIRDAIKLVNFKEE